MLMILLFSFMRVTLGTDKAECERLAKWEKFTGRVEELSGSEKGMKENQDFLS